MELVYTLALEASAARIRGSTPLGATKAGLMFNGQHGCLPSSTYRFESGALFQYGRVIAGNLRSLLNSDPMGSIPSALSKVLESAGDDTRLSREKGRIVTV